LSDETGLAMFGRIAFDGRWCGQHGIGRFAAELSRRLENLDPFFGSVPPWHALDPILLSIRMLATRRDVLFLSPGYNVPLLNLNRYVFTVHDLNHLDMPSDVLRRAYYRLLMRRACRSSAGVFTVSEFSRQRIVSWSGAAPARIINVGNGVSEAFNPAGPVRSCGDPYFLCIGNRKPHKNEARVVRAFAQADVPLRSRLVFNGLADAKLASVIQEVGIGHRVDFLGGVSDGHLAEAYRGATALLFPSLYEGFGLPLIEAMACGTPVLTSTFAALPEVAGGAALLVDPTSVPAIASGISRLASESDLRADLRQRGMARARDFQWAAVAARVQAGLNLLTQGVA
jgi:O-antigen biosynthesis alpha-1,2-mannosyltransferase